MVHRSARAMRSVLVLLLCATAASGETLDSLLVVGLQNQVKKRTWQDQRLGMGIRGRLTQMYADSGAFVLLEDRELAGSVQEAVDGYWLGESAAVRISDLARLHESSGADWIAFGELRHLGVIRHRVTGVIGGRQWTYRAEVELCIHASAGPRLCHTGSGKSTTRVVGAVVEYRGDDVAFDQAGPAEAIDRALVDAFNQLMPRWEQSYVR